MNLDASLPVMRHISVKSLKDFIAINNTYSKISIIPNGQVGIQGL